MFLHSSDLADALCPFQDSIPFTENAVNRAHDFLPRRGETGQALDVVGERDNGTLPSQGSSPNPPFHAPIFGHPSSWPLAGLITS